MMNSLKLSPLVVGSGKQLFGYAGVLNKDLRCIGGSVCYISLHDAFSETRYITVSNEEYPALVQDYDRLNLDIEDNIFLWVEVDTEEALLNWRLFKSPLNLEALLPAYQACYDFVSFYQLIEFCESLDSLALRQFVRSVLADEQLMTKFVSLAASRNHHHSFPGGLLMHSMECVYLTEQNLAALGVVSDKEREVAMVAALFHDIGKVKTMGEKYQTSLGNLIDHEQLTLQILAPYLEPLQTSWKMGAETLQYLLIWKESMGFCRYVSGNAIKMADRLSTSNSLNQMAFKDKPGYFHFAQLEAGGGTRYLNRLT